MNTAHVTGPGEPNKLCDLMAAAISEEYQKRDGEACTDIRVSGGRGAIFVAGLVQSTADFDVATLVKQVLGGIDPSLNLEPFIAIEPVAGLRRPSLQTTGYATKATPTYLPPAVNMGIGITRLLEDARQGDEGWFWLSPDFDVTIKEDAGNMQALLRVSHIDTVNIEDVRGQIRGLFDGRVERVVVNPAGPDTGNGLASGIGSSGQLRYEWYGAKLPGSSCVSGLELSHPANIGWMISRQLARELVKRIEGQAVMVDLFWETLADVPNIVCARDERGNDLTAHIRVEQLSRKRLSEKWNLSHLMSGMNRYSFDGTTDLPFENDDLLQ